VSLLRDDLAAIYPQFGLQVAHAGLALVPPTDVELLELTPVVGEPGAIVEPGREGPLLGWDDPTRTDPVDHFLRGHWRLRSRPTPPRWHAPFAVVVGGRAIGMAMLAREAGTERGTVSTSSWLARTEQGHGTGRRVRLMLLELAFAHLGATLATTAANEHNTAALRVSQRCGYRETHRGHDAFGVAVHAAATPAAWRRRRLADVVVEGVEPFREAIDPG
jgi:RimJ/RimL family protein N-acetyltransferase